MTLRELYIELSNYDQEVEVVVYVEGQYKPIENIYMGYGRECISVDAEKHESHRFYWPDMPEYGGVDEVLILGEK